MVCATRTEPRKILGKQDAIESESQVLTQGMVHVLSGTKKRETNVWFMLFMRWGLVSLYSWNWKLSLWLNCILQEELNLRQALNGTYQRLRMHSCYHPRKANV